MKKDKFKPTFFSIFYNLDYLTRKSLYENISLLIKKLNGKILDVGCGTKPYKNLTNYTEYIGLELESERHKNSSYADKFYDGKTFPFADNEFNCLISNQVLEHVEDELLFLREINRVLKKNGKLLLTVPFIWPEHEQPYDFRRYTSFGITKILNQNGFTVDTLIKSHNSISLIFQLFNTFLFKKLGGKINFLNLLIFTFFIIPSNILGLITYHFFPKTKDIYLDNVILATKTKHFNEI